MEYLTEQWQVIPVTHTGNRYALFLAISNEYAFAAANVLMGFQKHSPKLLSKLDVILYHENLTAENQKLLASIHPNIFFQPICFPTEWAEMLAHPHIKRWGIYILCKFFGFELIRHYEKALLLDADMHLLGDLSPLFETEEAMAWREILAWDVQKIFAGLLKPDRPMKSGNGGLFLFTDKLREYHIDTQTILETYRKIKDLADGGIDEDTISYLMYEKEIPVKELDLLVYNTPSKRINPQTRLVHFLDSNEISSKPWKNLASYLYYEDWAENDRRWLAMGGSGPVSFAKEDYYRLFGYDRAMELQKTKRELLKTKKELEKRTKALSKKEKEIEKLCRDRARLQMQNEKLQRKLTAVLQSKSWKITKPLRFLTRLFQKLLH